MKNYEEKLLAQKEVSEMLGISCSCLETWRTNKTGIAYVKIGRKVKYREQDVIDYINQNRVLPKDTNNLGGYNE